MIKPPSFPIEHARMLHDARRSVVNFGRRLTQKEVAWGLGKMVRTTVERWEKGEVRPPIEQLSAYLEFLVSKGLPAERAQSVFSKIVPADYPEIFGRMTLKAVQQEIFRRHQIAAQERDKLTTQRVWAYVTWRSGQPYDLWARQHFENVLDGFGCVSTIDHPDDPRIDARSAEAWFAMKCNDDELPDECKRMEEQLLRTLPLEQARVEPDNAEEIDAWEEENLPP
jgi:hypothetical protein